MHSTPIPSCLVSLSYDRSGVSRAFVVGAATRLHPRARVVDPLGARVSGATLKLLLAGKVVKDGSSDAMRRLHVRWRWPKAGISSKRARPDSRRARPTRCSSAGSQRTARRRAADRSARAERVGHRGRDRRAAVANRRAGHRARFADARAPRQARRARSAAARARRLARADRRARRRDVDLRARRQLQLQQGARSTASRPTTSAAASISSQYLGGRRRSRRGAARSEQRRVRQRRALGRRQPDLAARPDAGSAGHVLARRRQPRHAIASRRRSAGRSRRFDYFSEFVHLGTDNDLPNNKYRNKTYAGRFGVRARPQHRPQRHGPLDRSPLRIAERVRAFRHAGRLVPDLHDEAVRRLVADADHRQVADDGAVRIVRSARRTSRTRRSAARIIGGIRLRQRHDDHRRERLFGHRPRHPRLRPVHVGQPIGAPGLLRRRRRIRCSGPEHRGRRQLRARAGIPEREHRRRSDDDAQQPRGMGRGPRHARRIASASPRDSATRTTKSFENAYSPRLSVAAYLRTPSRTSSGATRA